MTRASMPRAALAATALLAMLPAALAAQRTASAATLPPAVARPVADTLARPADRSGPRPAESAAATLTIDRESFSYLSEGRRDPFLSLMTNGDLRPLISDLRLTTVIYVDGGQSVAVLRDLNTNEQHRVRLGQQLGRMRVAAIHPKQVVFTIEEFGFSRQESLALGDSTTPRTQQ
jgi:hypothetical protein